MLIPRYDPTYTLADLREALRLSYLDNPQQRLRARLAQIHNVRHVFLFGSARAALYTLLRAHGVKHGTGGEVVTPAYNCIEVPEAVSYAGFRPAFADIDDNSLNMSVKTLKQAISSATTAVLMTHTFGLPFDVPEILELCRRNHLLVIEDAAAAIGARWEGRLAGTLGDAAIFSFQRSKVVTGAGGGALLTSNAELAAQLERMLPTSRPIAGNLRTFGKAVAWRIAMRRPFYRGILFAHRILQGQRTFEVVAARRQIPAGFVSAFPAFAAALVLVQLDRLQQNVNRRIALATRYTSGLADCSHLRLPIVPPEASPAWIQLPIAVGNKQAFYEHMLRDGLDLSWTFRYSCPESYGLSGFPHARQAARQNLGLPTYPSLDDGSADRICALVKKVREPSA